ncbi:hypothetical protein [uncultured Chryseobacterium sp.]|nr:hypothetical protein [uncultured Chryseobacterium sp.]
MEAHRREYPRYSFRQRHHRIGYCVNGQLTVAQLSADFSIPTAITPQMIGNLNREILDNENKYTESVTDNSFEASVNGVYEITINVQLSTEYGSYPVLGLWDDTTGK